MAVGSLVIRPLRHHQHARLAQHVQQRIAPQARAGVLQRLLEQMVQLARAQSGLTQAHAGSRCRHVHSVAADAATAGSRLGG